MQVKRLQGFLSWFVVLSELSHVFCCVLPSVFTMLTVLVTMGVMGAMPGWMNDVHDVMHGWEVPIIAMSGVVLVLSWGLHLISKRIDCHDTGCVHEPCEPKKDKNALILKIATVLFVTNISVYSIVHRPYHHAHAEHHHETGAVIEADAHHHAH